MYQEHTLAHRTHSSENLNLSKIAWRCKEWRKDEKSVALGCVRRRSAGWSLHMVACNFLHLPATDHDSFQMFQAALLASFMPCFSWGLPQAVRNAAAASMMASILATSTPALAEEAHMFSVGKEMCGYWMILVFWSKCGSSIQNEREWFRQSSLNVLSM